MSVSRGEGEEWDGRMYIWFQWKGEVSEDVHKHLTTSNCGGFLSVYEKIAWDFHIKIPLLMITAVKQLISLPIRVMMYNIFLRLSPFF